MGKTTTAVNLGAALAESGLRVLVVDLDPQGNATTGLGINPRDVNASIYDVLMQDTPALDAVEPTSLKNLFVIPATLDLAGAEIELVPAFSRELKLKRALDAVRDEYDVVLIDCPPSLGLLTVNGLAAADDVIVPDPVRVLRARRVSGSCSATWRWCARASTPTLDVRGIILTMYDARTRLADQVETEVREHFGAKVYKTVVPRTVRLAEAPSFGQPIIVFDSDVAGCDGVPGPGERGERWRDAADWVRGSARSSPRAGPRARRPSAGGLDELPAGVDQAEPVPAAGPLRRGGARRSLADSIREVGVLQPVLVRPVGDGEYELIAGERRWRAARRVGLQTIPALVRETDDAAALEQALVENLHRDDLNPLEEAAAYQQLIEDFGLTHDEVAARVGRSRATVTNTLRLMQLPPAIQKSVQEGKLSMGHARALLGTPDRAFQEQLAKRVVDEDLSVRAVEEAVREHQGDEPRRAPATARPARRRADPAAAASARACSSSRSCSATTSRPGSRSRWAAARGKVVVEFSTLEDLERIYRLITDGGRRPTARPLARANCARKYRSVDGSVGGAARRRGARRARRPGRRRRPRTTSVRMPSTSSLRPPARRSPRPCGSRAAPRRCARPRTASPPRIGASSRAAPPSATA